MQNAISWFEIPATDLERSQKFYETIFAVDMLPMDMHDMRIRMFPIDDMMTGNSGALVENNGFHKSSATDGPLIYLNANPDLQFVLDKIEIAGGKITMPKTEISPEHGFMAVFEDTEGNRMALHSINQ